MSFTQDFIAAMAQHDVEVDYLLTLGGTMDDGINADITRYYSSRPMWLDNPFTEYVGLYDSTFTVTRSMQGVLSAENNVQGFPSYSEVEIFNHLKELDTDWGATGYKTLNQPVTLEIFAQPRRLLGPQRGVIFSGLAGRHDLSDERMSVPLENLEKRLTNTLLATRTVDATTFPNAPASSLGLPIPRIFGSAKHVRLTRISTADPDYIACEDSSGIPAVYSNGLVYDPANYSVELKAAAGTIVSFPSTLDPGTSIVTADVLGEVAIKGYSDRLASIGARILQLCGIDYSEEGSLDIDEILALDAAFPFSMSLPLYGPVTGLEAMRKLTAGIPDFFSHQRDGRFVWGIYQEPSGTAEISVTDDVEVLDSTLLEEVPLRGFTFRYDPIETTIEGNNLADAVNDNPDLVERLRHEFLEWDGGDSPYLANATDYEKRTYDTRITNLDDIKTLNTSLLSLYGKRHNTMDITMRLQALAIQGLNSVIDVVRPRLGIRGASHLWRVVQMTEQHNRGQSEIKMRLRD